MGVTMPEIGQDEARMAPRRHTPDQVLAKLRDAEVMITNGWTLAEVAKKLGSAGHRHRVASETQERTQGPCPIAPTQLAETGTRGRPSRVTVRTIEIASRGCGETRSANGAGVIRTPW